MACSSLDAQLPGEGCRAGRLQVEATWAGLLPSATPTPPWRRPRLKAKAELAASSAAAAQVTRNRTVIDISSIWRPAPKAVMDWRRARHCSATSARTCGACARSRRMPADPRKPLQVQHSTAAPAQRPLARPSRSTALPPMLAGAEQGPIMPSPSSSPRIARILPGWWPSPSSCRRGTAPSRTTALPSMARSLNEELLRTCRRWSSRTCSRWRC